MASKHFANKARRAWWSVHVEAWFKSGLPRATYCRQQHLNRQTFNNWLSVLPGAEALKINDELARERQRLRRQRQRHGPSRDKRHRATQAFWAMHVEALNWSGLTMYEYAAALGLSRFVLRRWRERLDDGEVEIDWRALLHPGARPKMNTSAKGGAKGCVAESGLTAQPDDDPRTPEKQTRRHSIVTSVLVRWRADLRFGKNKRAKLATVKLADGGTGTPPMPLVLHDLLQPPDGMIAVELDDGRRVFVPIGSDPEAVRQHVLSQETAR